MQWNAIVQVWECYTILCPDWLYDYDLVDIIELIPVIITLGLVPHKWFKFWPPWNSKVEGLSSEEGL